jgi:hypothetical protein
VSAEGPEQSAEGKRTRPAWKGIPFNAFLAYSEEAGRLRHLTIQGIEGISHQGRLAAAVARVEAFDSGDEGWSEHDDPHVQSARAIANMAKEELEGEFPLVNAHTLVGLWGAFEAVFEDLVVCWFVNEPDRLMHERLRRMKVPVELLVSDSEERARFIVLEYLRSIGGDLKVGIGRSESLLELIDLTGPVDDDLRRSLLEAHQVRNLYAHRGGIVDQRFAERCPWIGAVVGERFRINNSMFDRYHRSIHDYVLLVINRILIQEGSPPYEDADEGHIAAEGGEEVV